MARRKVRDEDDARTLLEGLAQSDLDLAAWARREGVDGRSLNAWKLNLARRDRASHAPLRVVELVAQPPEPRPAPITVRCGPFAIDVPHDVDEDHLVRVLALVAAC